MTDVEMGQLLVSDLFAELAFDDNEENGKPPGTARRRDRRKSSSVEPLALRFKNCLQALGKISAQLVSLPRFVGGGFPLRHIKGSFSSAVEQMWIQGFFKAWAKPAS